MNDEQPKDASAASRTDDEGAEAEEAPGLRLRSLKVHVFRDVRPGTELRFGDGPHLILGKNGSGKSTLLALLAAVPTLDFSGPFFADTPFHVEASLEIAKASVYVEIRRTFEPQQMKYVGEEFFQLSPRDEAEVIVQIEHRGAMFRQWIRARRGENLRFFSDDPRQDKAKSVGLELPDAVDPLKLTLGRALFFGVLVHGIRKTPPEVWSAVLKLVRRPGTGTPFDEALGALHAMTGSGLTIVRGKNPPSISPWLPPALDFDAKGEPVVCRLLADPLLKTAVERLGYNDAKSYFGPGASTERGWTYSAPSFQFFLHGKAVRRHDQLSFGQQRLFSFAWYLACNPDVVIADELVNGLHSEWIDWCVEAIGDRQCFLTSQNPILVDAISFDSEEDLRRGIILCESTQDAEREMSELSWRQLDDHESELIARAFQKSRLDLLSDLLRALNMW